MSATSDLQITVHSQINTLLQDRKYQTQMCQKQPWKPRPPGQTNVQAKTTLLRFVSSYITAREEVTLPRLRLFLSTKNMLKIKLLDTAPSQWREIGTPLMTMHVSSMVTRSLRTSTSPSMMPSSGLNSMKAVAMLTDKFSGKE